MRIVRARKKVQVPGYEEQEASPEFLDERGGEGRPEEVPDGGDAVDKELDRGGGGADLVQDLIDVVGEETVARPLREDSRRNSNPHALPVYWLREERLSVDAQCGRAQRQF